MTDKRSLRVREGDVVVREVGDTLVVLNVETAKYLSLNDTAAFLWRRLEAGASPDEMANSLAGEYGIDISTAASDTAAFVETVRDFGLIDTPS